MKRFIVLSLFVVFCLSCYSEGELSISELEMLCQKNNWLEVVNYVQNRDGWIFDYSKIVGVGVDDKKIRMLYNVDQYQHEKSQGWLYIYTDGDKNDEIISIEYFHINNKTGIGIDLQQRGYKKIKENLENEGCKLLFSNSKFLFEVSTQKYEDTYAYFPITSYKIIIKGRQDDPYNGHKVHYDVKGHKYEEYTVKNGKLVGEGMYDNKYGKIIRKGVFSNGKMVSYSEIDYDGNVLFESSLLNDSISSFVAYEYDQYGNIEVKSYGKECYYYLEARLYTDDFPYGIGLYSSEKEKYSDYIKEYYDKGIITGKEHIKCNNNLGESEEKNTKNQTVNSLHYYKDTLHGECKWFVYDEKGHLEIEKHHNYNRGLLNGHLREIEHICDSITIELEADYSNGKKNGAVTLTLIKNGNKTIVGMQNYKFGNVVGNYMWNTHDTLEIGYYDSNGKPNGDFKSYRCLKMCDGTDDVPLSVNEKDLVLIAKGKYINGEKQGQWININDNGSIETKEYNNGVLHGKMSFTDKNGHVMNYGSFVDGKRNGLWYQYSWEEDLDGRSLDTCLYDKGKWVKSVLSKGDSTYRYYATMDGFVTSIVCELIIDKRLRERKTYSSISNLELLNDAYFGYPVGLESDSLNGLYESYDEKGRCLARGLYTNGNKSSGWFYYLWNDDLCIYCSVNGIWIIKTISKGKLYTGKFRYDTEYSTYIFNATKGVLNGKTIIKDLNSQQIVGYRQYKNGMLVKDWEKK